MVLIIRNIVLFFFLVFSFPISAGSDTEGRIIAEGGRLYDKWWEEYDLNKPSTTNPAYPASGRKKGAATWRCKECHGWDYRGRRGAYGKGSHFTGIKGIDAYAGREPSLIVNILKNDLHNFDEVMLDYGLLRVAQFVSKGQVDISPYIKKGTKKVNGDIRRGKQVFKKHCVDCHGSDGRERNFKDDNDPEYVGTVAIKNPWEAMHKLRNGHPGAFVMGDPMPSMILEIGLQSQIDLLAYLQTLMQQHH